MKKLVLLFFIAAYSITIFIPFREIFSDAPIYTDDYAMHFSQCLSAKRFFSSAGKCWGYDPFFLAGFPRGALVNADNKAWEALFFVLSPLPEGLAFKAYLYLFMLLYPFLVYAAARNFHLSKNAAFLAALLGMLYFHLSLTIDFVSWGMLSYVFVCYLSLYLLSLFYRLFETFTWKRYIAATILSSLTLMMHILSPILLGIPLLILYAASLRRLPPAGHCAVVLMTGIVIFINSYWLIPLVQFFPDKTARPENYTFALQITNLLEPVNVYLRQQQGIPYRKVPQLNNTFIEVMLLLLGSAGWMCLRKEHRNKLLLSSLGGVLFLFVIAYYGSHTSLFPQLQPQRFTIPLNLLLVIPATIGLQRIFQTLMRDKRTPAILFTCALVFVLLVGPVAKPLKTIYGYDLYRLSGEFPAPLKDLMGWMAANTDRTGRILVEDSEYDSGHQFYGAHFPALFPERVKREYLCGPRPLYPIKHSYASFTAGMLFEKKIGDYTPGELQYLFDLYNVKWIVCWSGESRRVFDQYREYTRKVAVIDAFTLYEVQRAPGFFVRGRGEVTSDYNRLELTGVVPENGEIIIGYHWMKGLKTEPERTLEQVFLGGDPIGFIRILDPPPSLVIYNGY